MASRPSAAALEEKPEGRIATVTLLTGDTLRGGGGAAGGKDYAAPLQGELRRCGTSQMTSSPGFDDRQSTRLWLGARCTATRPEAAPLSGLGARRLGGRLEPHGGDPHL